MSSINKLLGLASVGSTIANVSLLQRFLTDVTAVVALTAVAGTMLGAIVILGFYGLYLGLIAHGLDPQTAFIAVSVLALVVIALVTTIAVMRWRHLRATPHNILSLDTPIVAQVGRLVDSFLAGLMGPETHRDR